MIYKTALFTTLLVSNIAIAVEMFDETKIYSTSTEVRYSEQDSQDQSKYLTAQFENSYWVNAADDKPSFTSSNSAWKRITNIGIVTHTDPLTNEGTITATTATPVYNEGSSYTGGSIVSNGAQSPACYQAKWWTTEALDGSTWKSVTCPIAGPIEFVAIGAAGSDSVSQDINTNATNGGCEASFPAWNTGGTYLAGQMVEHNGTYYKAKWWTQGNNPSDGTGNPWDTPWAGVTHCPVGEVAEQEVVSSETFTGIPSGNDVDPVISGADVATATTTTADEVATQKAASQTITINSPVVPPVIPTTPTATSSAPTTIALADFPVDGSGYEFLRLVTTDDWDWLFPMRSGKFNTNGGTRNQPPFAESDGSKDTFSLANFKKAVFEYNNWAAANNYKQFLNEGTLKQQAEEFLIFWAKSSRETSGSWSTATAPWIVTEAIGDENITAWKGGLYWVEEVGYTTNPDTGKSKAINYVDAGSIYTPAPGRSYYGRGVIQLSWNYNYGAFSKWLYDNELFKDIIEAEDTLLRFPNLVADNGALSIMSGIWFWMTPQGAKPSSHDVLLGNAYNVSTSTQDQGLPQSNDSGFTIPTASGGTTDEAVFAYRLGTVINIVNGGLECNKAAKWHGGPVQRVFYYDAYAAYFNDTHSVGANRISDAKANDPANWTQNISDSSPLNLQSATCYNQKSYYGW